MIFQKNKNYRQGIFRPSNPQKYKGSQPIIYRSSLELKAFRAFDKNPRILSWGSESVVIPYQGIDGKIHRYFVDIVCEMVRKDGTVKKYLIEIKPEKQIKPPIESQKKSKKTQIYEKYQFATNQAKWEAAKKWCDKKNMVFLVMNEKHIAAL